MTDNLLHKANLLVNLAAFVTAEGAVARAVAGVGGLLSWQALSGQRAAPDLEARIADAMRARLAWPEVTPDQRALIPQMIESALPAPHEIIAAGLDRDTLIARMEAGLNDPEHRRPETLSLFRAVLTPALDRLLSDRDFTATLAPAFMRGVLAGLDGLDANTQAARDAALAALDQGRRVEDKIDLLPDQFAAIIAKLPNATRPELVAVADRFEITGAEGMSDIALRRELEKKAEDWRALRAQIEAIPDGMRQLSNLKGAAQAAFEAGRFDEVEELLERVHQVEIEEAAKTAELRAETALLRGRVDQAYALLSAAADSFAGIDPLEPARRRIHRYVKVLYDHGLRYGSRGLKLGQELLDPVLTNSLRQSEPMLWAAGKNAQAIGLSALGKFSGGVFGAELMKEAVSTYREVLEVHTRTRAPHDWAAAKTNLGTTLTALAQQSPGTPGLLMLREAVDVLRAALKEREKKKDPRGILATLNSLGNALRLQGERTKGPKGVALLDRSVRVFESALEHPQISSSEERAAVQMSSIAPLLLLGAKVPGSGGAAYLDKAMRAAHGALEVFSVEHHPVIWADTQISMAFAFLHRADHDTCTDPAPHLRTALDHVEAALEVFDPEHMPFNHQRATALRNHLRQRLGL